MTSTSIALEVRGDGVRLPLRVQPKAKRSAIVGVHDGRLKVAVTAAPEKGKANAAVIELLAEALNIARGQITIVAGETSQKKTVEVAGLTVDEVRQRLERCLMG